MTTQVSADATVLSLGEWAVARDPGQILKCLGLGSCVALCLHDAAQRVGGMAHMVLPDSAAMPQSQAGRSNAAKFVDLAVPLVVSEMEAIGARRIHMRATLVGGARMLKAAENSALATIGIRNVTAARDLLKQMGIRLQAEEVGGDAGRTVSLLVASGAIHVKTARGSFELK